MRYHVLYVEDQDINVLLMQALMGHRPQVQLAIATTADAGWHAAMACRPDLLLLDWRLPDATGGELLAQLRTQPSLADVPAVAVTAEDDFVRDGFCALWPKPLNVRDTLQSLDDLLARIDDARLRTPPQWVSSSCLSGTVEYSFNRL